MIITTFSKKRRSTKPKKIGRLRRTILGSTKAGLATRIGVVGSAMGGLTLARRYGAMRTKSSQPIPVENTPVYKAAKTAANQATQGAVEGSVEGLKASAGKIVLQPIKQTYKKVRQKGYGPEAKVRAIGRQTGAIYGKVRAKGRKAEAQVMGVYGKLRAIGRGYEQKVTQQYRNLRAAGKKAEKKVLRSRKSR